MDFSPAQIAQHKNEASRLGFHFCGTSCIFGIPSLDYNQPLRHMLFSKSRQKKLQYGFQNHKLWTSIFLHKSIATVHNSYSSMITFVFPCSTGIGPSLAASPFTWNRPMPRVPAAWDCLGPARACPLGLKRFRERVGFWSAKNWEKTTWELRKVKKPMEFVWICLHFGRFPVLLWICQKNRVGVCWHPATGVHRRLGFSHCVPMWRPWHFFCFWGWEKLELQLLHFTKLRLLDFEIWAFWAGDCNLMLIVSICHSILWNTTVWRTCHVVIQRPSQLHGTGWSTTVFSCS